MPRSESFLECGTVNAKPRTMPGKPGLLIILESKDNGKLDLGTASLDRMKTKCSERDWMYNLVIEGIMARN